MASNVHKNRGKVYPDLVDAARQVLRLRPSPYVIENVVGAPLGSHVVQLCGLMFGLKVFRHRLFESSFCCLQEAHPDHSGKRIGEGYFSVAGGSGRWKTWGTVQRNVSKGSRAQWREAMGIDWMNRHELTQAIPPAYTEFIGKQLISYLNRSRKVS